MPNVLNWKRYLTEQELYTGDVCSSDMNDDFKRAIASFESYITDRIPIAKGMVWSNNQIRTTVKDAKEAMYLLTLYKQGQATLDAIGPIDESREGSYFNQLFISQDEAKADEWSPNKNQNQGTWQNPLPKKDFYLQKLPGNEKQEIQPEKAENINSRMNLLVDFIESQKK